MPTSTISPAPQRRRRRGRAAARPGHNVRPEVRWTLDAITGAAAYVGNAASTSWPPTTWHARSSPSCTPPRPDPSTTPASCSSTRERRRSTPTGNAPPATPWRSCAGPQAATRTTATLSDLVGELATHSDEFRTRWAAHDVRFHNTAVKHFRHPVVGELSFSFNLAQARRRPRARALHLRRRARLPLG